MADDFVFLDGTSGTKTMRSTELSGGQHAVHKVIERQPGAGTWNFAPVVIGTTATAIKAATALRRRITLKHSGEGDTIYLGSSTAVTVADGYPLYNNRGETVELRHKAAVYGIVATSTSTVAYSEEVES